jgi:hypothetical protein
VGRVRLAFEGGEGGITAVALSGTESLDLDGLPALAADPASVDSARTQAPPGHPIGAVRVDHIVAFTPDLERTVAALEKTGIELRRRRGPDEPGPPAAQAFFRLGEVILEVVERSASSGPAGFWGITFRVADLDACARLLGERLGEPREAVQPGRRIATLRREAGLGLPVALISEKPGRKSR